jgi:hypothetical protein
LSFDVVEGELAVETIELRVNGKRRRIREDIRAVAGKRVSVKL